MENKLSLVWSCAIASLFLGLLFGWLSVGYNSLGVSDRIVLYAWLQAIALAFCLGFSLFSLAVSLLINRLGGKRIEPARFFIPLFVGAVFFVFAYRILIYDWPIGPGHLTTTIRGAFAVYWSLTALLVIAALGIMAGLFFAAARVPASLRERPFAARLFLVAVCIVGMLFTLSRFGPTAPAESAIPDLPPASETQRLIIVGVDGASWNVIDHMIGQGELDNFRELIENGTSGRLQTYRPTSSPLLWTTIASGLEPDDHKILSFTVYRFPGMSRGAYFPHGIIRMVGILADFGVAETFMVNHTFGPSPKLWDITGMLGRKSIVTGPLLSWPATKVNGSMLADELYEKLDKDGGLENMARNPEQYSNYIYPFKEIPDIVGGLDYEKIMKSRDTLNGSIFFKQAEAHPDFDFAFVYLRNVDLVCHGHYYREGGIYPEGPGAEKVTEAYLYVDKFLGRLRKIAGPGARIMIVSDHGFETYLINGTFVHATHIKATPGVFILAGEGIKRGHRIEGTHIRDIAPTALALMNLPVAKEMNGRVLSEAMESRGPVEFVDSYAWAAPGVSMTGQTDSDIDQKRLQQLRDLGYIE